MKRKPRQRTKKPITQRKRRGPMGPCPSAKKTLALTKTLRRTVRKFTADVKELERRLKRMAALERRTYFKKYRDRLGKMSPMLDICDRSYLILHSQWPHLSLRQITDILRKERIYNLTFQSLDQRVNGKKGKSLSLQQKIRLLEDKLTPKIMAELKNATEEFKNQFVSEVVRLYRDEYLDK